MRKESAARPNESNVNSCFSNDCTSDLVQLLLTEALCRIQATFVRMSTMHKNVLHELVVFIIYNDEEGEWSLVHYLLMGIFCFKKLFPDILHALFSPLASLGWHQGESYEFAKISQGFFFSW